MRRWLESDLNLPASAGVALIALWPFLFDNAYDHRLLSLAGAYALMALGYQFIFGHAGQLALTQATFFGLGAYATGIASQRLGWDATATLPLSILVPTALALALAPLARLKSHYFALATLAVAESVLLIVVQWRWLTGGANGIAGVPGLMLLGWSVPTGLPMLAAIWLMVAILGWLAWRWQSGLGGLAFQLARADEMAVASLGIDPARLRRLAFLAGAAAAGLGGAFYAHLNRVVSPESLGLPVMVGCLAMVVIGGRTRVAGAILGAVLIVHLPEWLRVLKDYYLIVYGLAILLAVVLAPDGLVGAALALKQRLVPEPPRPAPPPSVLPRPAARRGQHSVLLELAGVSKRFGGVHALEHVSLRIREGEVMGLIGPNGSGKTTLVNLVTGVYRPEAGRIVIAGTETSHLAPHAIARLGVARSFQAVKLAGAMTALDNVAVARTVEGSGGAFGWGEDPRLTRARGEAMHCLERLGVADAALKPVEALPHGQRRRIEIARALATSPRLMLLDEPAAGLTEREQQELAEMLIGLAGSGITLLVIEHNMPFIMGIAQHMICLDRGRIVASGTPDEIRTNRRALAAYLGATEAVS
jgi:branched-chain amino acid transport system permease protein